MNPDELMRAFGEISDKYITEALVDDENGGFLEETGADFDDCMTDILAEFSQTEDESNIKTFEIPSREIIEIPEETEDGNDCGEEIPEIITLEKKSKIKKLASVAVIVICFGMILSSVNLAAKAYGVDTIAILREFGDRIIEMFVGEKVEYKGITIIKKNESIEYDSFQKFFAEEKLDILYPTKLPDGVNFSNTYIIYDKFEEISVIKFVTDSPKINISLKLCSDEDSSFLLNGNLKNQIINGFKCYIDDTGDFDQFMFIYKEYIYTVITSTQADTVTIIENLKEFN